MKKLIAMLLALVMVLSLAACAGNNQGTNEPENNDPVVNNPENNEPENNEPENNEPAVMTYADYVAAAIDDEVTVECYVQGHQS